MNIPYEQELRYHLLKILEHEPDLSQREMAKRMGISLGKVNYCLTELAKRGFIKINKFKSAKNKRTSLVKSYWKPEINREISSKISKIIKVDNDNDRLIQIFKENHILKKIDKAKDVKITLMEGDFFDKVNQFKWQDENEKQIFIKEMIALSPNERKMVLEEMLKDFDYNLSIE